MAKIAFDHLIRVKKAGRLDSHHADYIVEQGTGKLDWQRLDSETGKPHVDLREGRLLSLGYFRVGFDCPSLSAGIRWVIGKGTPNHKFRNVDIMLSDPDKGFGKDFEPSHLFLTLNMDSGAWVICAPGPAELDDEPFEKNGSLCLSRHQMELSVCGLRFRVEFVIDNAEKERGYLQVRNERLKYAGIPIPKTACSGIPFDGDKRLQSATFRVGLGAGGYATVFQGFSLRQGTLRAIKRITLQRESSRQVVKNEIKALQILRGRVGIVGTFEYANSLGEAEPTAGNLPLDVYIVQEQGVEFGSMNWTECGWSVRIDLLRQLLQGLVAIHNEGWIHRDVTYVNILYLEGPNPGQTRAVLIDFGKVCFSRTHSATSLANARFRAPEVISAHPRPECEVPYDQKIDVWGLALANAWVWCTSAMLDTNRWYTATNTIELIRRIVAYTENPLAATLTWMLQPDPASRPTADQVLHDRIFGSNVRIHESEDLSQEKESGGKGKRKAG